MRRPRPAFDDRLALPLLLIVVALGGWIRYLPVADPATVGFEHDPAFHLRMVEEVIRTGAVPERDSLGLPPDGKPVPRLLPVGLYHLMAAAHRLHVAIAPESGLVASVLLANALLGALVAVPVFVAARALGLGPAAALVAALAAAVSPAHVHRTAAPFLRYDALGTLLLVTHLAGLVGAAAARSRRGAWTAGAMAAVALLAALAVWRVALAAVALEALLALALWVDGVGARRATARLAAALVASLGAASVAGLLLPYLASAPSGPFLASHQGLLLLLALAALATSALRRGDPGPWSRVGRRGRAALLVAGVAAILLLGRGTPYDALRGALAAKLGEPGAPAAPGTGAANVAVPPDVVFATTSELASPRLEHLLDADYFALLLPLAVLYGLGRLLPPRRPLLPPPCSPAPGTGIALWHGATLVCLTLTLLFARTKVLAAPLLALDAALLVAAAGRLPAGARARPARGDRHLAVIAALAVVLALAAAYVALRLAPAMAGAARPAVVAGGVVAAAALAAGMALRGGRAAPVALALGMVAWTGLEGVALARVLPSALPPAVARGVELLAHHADPGDVVLADWGNGYTIQLGARLPTVTDGFLESEAMRRRIGAFARALYADDEAVLADLCARYDVRFVWIPGQRRQMLARHAGLDHRLYWAGREPTARGRRTVYGRILAVPGTLTRFAPRAAIGPDVILEVVDEPGVSGSAQGDDGRRDDP
jgi:hypothetical protein